MAATVVPTGHAFQHTFPQLVLLDAGTGGLTILLTSSLGYVVCLQDHEEQGPRGIVNVWERR